MAALMMRERMTSLTSRTISSILRTSPCLVSLGVAVALSPTWMSPSSQGRSMYTSTDPKGLLGLTDSHGSRWGSRGKSLPRFPLH